MFKPQAAHFFREQKVAFLDQFLLPCSPISDTLSILILKGACHEIESIVGTIRCGLFTDHARGPCRLR